MSSQRHVVVRLGSMTLRLERRSAVVGLVIAAVTALAAIGALLLGDYAIGVRRVLESLSVGSGDPLADYFVREIRLPRVTAAILVGAALGASGAIFQSVSGNALGSPDIIGFTTGSATGAVLQIIVFDGGPVAIALGAIIGGFVTAAVVYALAYRGGLAGYRLVLVGIGVAAILQAVNSLLVLRASLDAAMTAGQWLAGSLNAMTWPRVEVLAVAVVVMLAAALGLSRDLDLMRLGDDVATGLGVRVERRRAWLVVVGVGLVATATAATGPIAFVALAAPQLARRLTRTGRIAMGSSAAMGALLVLVSDVIAQRIFAPTQLAVGVVTGSLGGLYLIWLLSTEWKRARG